MEKLIIILIQLNSTHNFPISTFQKKKEKLDENIFDEKKIQFSPETKIWENARLAKFLNFKKFFFLTKMGSPVNQALIYFVIV